MSKVKDKPQTDVPVDDEDLAKMGAGGGMDHEWVSVPQGSGFVLILTVGMSGYCEPQICKKCFIVRCGKVKAGGPCERIDSNLPCFVLRRNAPQAESLQRNQYGKQ